MWNLFKVNNTDTRTKSLARCYGVFFVDFENKCWLEYSIIMIAGGLTRISFH